MNTSKSKDSALYIPFDGAIGFVCAAGLFLPVAYWSLEFWKMFYPGISYSAEDLMTVIICLPITAIIGCMSGIAGGHLGHKIRPGYAAEMIGAAIGGILMGVILPGSMIFIYAQG